MQSREAPWSCLNSHNSTMRNVIMVSLKACMASLYAYDVDEDLDISITDEQLQSHTPYVRDRWNESPPAVTSSAPPRNA